MLRISQMRPLSAPLARAARPRSYHGRSILRHSTSLDGASERPGCHARGGARTPWGEGQTRAFGVAPGVSASRRTRTEGRPLSNAAGFGRSAVSDAASHRRDVKSAGH